MLIDLRYHVVTLVAVFLALAVGILVGSSFLAGTSVERQVARGLEQEFGKLRTENHDQQITINNLNDQSKKRDDFDRAAAPMLVDGRLLHNRVAIIQTGDYSEATQSAKSILEEAGAHVASITTISDLNSETASDQARRAVELITGGPANSDPVALILDGIARSVVAGTDLRTMNILEQKGLITKVGKYDHRVQTVVLVGGSKEKDLQDSQLNDLALIDKLQSYGVLTIVAAEPAYAVTSYIRAYHRKNISTVDDVDQPMGQVSLVCMLAGETGNFGVKKSADRVVPAYLESKEWRIKSRR